MTIDSDVVIAFGSLITAVVLHELAHGFVAFRLGDDTARRAGRLTLNPIKHLDPFGSVLLPLMGAVSGLPVFGYAKPIPVVPGRLRSPRRDLVLVALAGPAANFALASVGVLVARFSFVVVDERSEVSLLTRTGVLFGLVNLFLGLFNLVPIPPLDGSRIVERMLPLNWLPQWRRLGQYGFLIVFALVLLGAADHVFTPAVDRVLAFVQGR